MEDGECLGREKMVLQKEAGNILHVDCPLAGKVEELDDKDEDEPSERLHDNKPSMNAASTSVLQISWPLSTLGILFPLHPSITCG